MEGLPERFGKYHVLERIARGGMAEIYMVKTIGIAGFEKVQALKRILPAFAQRPRFIRSFIDEARIAVELNHRNIVQVFDFGRADGELYLAMELIDGYDLRTAIRDAARRRVELPIPLSCYLLGEIGAGLEYAHSKRDVQGRPLGIVHCDVSPQNIMLSREGFVKILDFGVARARFGTAPKERRLRGKPRYMAPEQTRGEPPTAATDVFALAIIAWELLTGLPLFDGGDLPGILAAVRRADVPSVDKLNPDVPEQLSRAVSRALSPRPEDRGTSAELSSALHAAGRAMAAGIGSRAFAGWLDSIYPPPVREETGRTAIEVPAASPIPDGEGTLNTATATLSQQLLEEIDEELDVNAPVALMDRRHVVAVVLLADAAQPATERELVRMLADLAYKRGAVLHEQTDDSMVALFGLEVAGEDNVARAMGYALDSLEVGRSVSAVAEGELSLRIAARAGIVAKRSEEGYHLVGDAVEDARALARDAEPGRPLLSGGADRMTSAHFAFRELPARRHRRRRLRVLELLGPRSFDERGRALRERRGRFVGRQAELARLAAVFADCVRNDQREAVTVRGRAGVGKSRLVAEFVARASSSAAVRPMLVAVTATPAGQMAPFSLVTEILQTALNLPPGRGGPARGRLVQRLRHVMTQSGTNTEDVDEAVGAVELAMELRDGAVVKTVAATADLRERIVVALRTFRNSLRRGDRPMITVIEDMHYADATSAEVLRNFLRPPVDTGAELMIFTTRPRPEGETPLAQHFPEPDDDAHAIALEELTGDDRIELIRDRLAGAANEAAVQAVAQRAGGNPFLIEELATAVREVGPVEIPSSARDVILTRVDGLPPAAKAAVQHAAVIGRTFRARILEELLGTEPGPALQELLEEGILQRSDRAAPEAEEGELEFTHGLFQEVVYESLSAPARRNTHATLGKLLVSRYQAGREEPPATIAYHLEHGGEYASAAAYSLRAGRVALAAFDAQAAVEAFTRTLALEEKGRKPGSSAAKARRREALSGREQAHGLRGDHDAQGKDLAKLERLAEKAPRRLAEVKNRQAERLLRVGDYAAAVACTERAEKEAERGGDERALGESLRLRAEAYERQGDYGPAQQALERALEIFERIGAVVEETRAMIGSGRIHLMQAQYETAREAYGPIVERIAEAGDAWLERIVSNHISVIRMCLGEFESAMTAAQRSLEICRRIGDRAREGDNISVCGIILLEVGRYEEARSYFTQALDALGQTASKWSRADCLVYAGATEANLGRYDKGLSLIEEAVSVAREIGAKYVEANALVALAGALLRRNRDEEDVDRALEAGTQAAMTARDARLVGPEIQGLSRQAEAMWRAGYLDAALALSTRAMRLLDNQHFVEGSEEEILFRHYRLLVAAEAPEAPQYLDRAWAGYQRKLGLLTKPEWIDAFANAIDLHVALRGTTAA